MYTDIINYRDVNSSANPYDNAYKMAYNDGSGDYSLEVPRREYLVSDVKIHTVKDGETLQGIANAYYGDSGYWYILADINNISNPFAELYVGLQLTVPINHG